MIRWLAFGVVIGSILPFGLNWLLAVGASKPHNIDDLLGGGEMLLTCIALSAASLGELFGRSSGSRSRNQEILAGAASIVAAIIASVWFASVKSGGNFGKTVVTVGSLLLFLSTLAAAGACIYLSVPEQEVHDG
jgi:hypothetical protein